MRWKVARQDVQQEAADELLGGERHCAELVALAGVTPVEADVAVLDGQDSVVGECHAVGVATDIVEDLGGSVEGRLGIDDPLGLAQGLEVAGEGGGLPQEYEGAREP